MRRITAATVIATGVAAAAGAAAPGAVAHIERDPQFVDPAPDTSIFPAAGGDFVRYRPLSDQSLRLGLFRRYARAAWVRGVTRRERDTLRRQYVRLDPAQQRAARRFLVALRRSRGRGPTVGRLGLGDRSMVQSETTHVVCRPDSLRRMRAGLTVARDLSAAQRRATIRKNERLFERCRHREIQSAVTAADNNDTVAILPGFYTEPTARAQPHNDPRCADMVEQTETGRTAPSYRYQATCPNDLALIAVIGRDPDSNRCVRCNLQIDGTGARPEDVIIEAAAEPRDPGVQRDLFDLSQKKVPSAKENVIRADRADGFYVRNLTVRNAEHNGVYGNEMDGMTVSRVNMFWNHEYGHLSFVTDHNVVKHSRAAGSADGGLYPGASPPSRPRINTVVMNNVADHNVLGFSGTMGSNVRIVDNDFRHNSVGISLDSFYRAGHPGFPQNSTVIEGNRIHSNNFNTFAEDSPVRSTVQAAVGTGMWIVGGNDNLVKGNWIYDNWRHGTMLITVPDALSNNLEKPPEPEQDTKLSTSHRNRFEENHLGLAPDGRGLPNGTDHWWDEHGQGNCWRQSSPFTSDPSRLPDCDTFPNQGAGNPVKTAQLAACGFADGRDENTPACDWYQSPPPPGGRP
jgi:hypothetical protein